MDWSSLAEHRGKGHASARPCSPSAPPRRAAAETDRDGGRGGAAAETDGDGGEAVLGRVVAPIQQRPRRPLPRPRSGQVNSSADQSLVASKVLKDEEGGETGQSSWEAAVSHQQVESVVEQEGQSGWEAAVSHQQVEPVVYLGAAESDQLAGVVEDPEAAESDWRAERQDLVFGTAHQMIADGETETSQMTALEQENVDPRMTALEEENRLLREKNAVLDARLDVLQNAVLGLGKRVAKIEVFKNETGKRIKGCEDAIAALPATSNEKVVMKVRGSAGGPKS